MNQETQIIIGRPFVAHVDQNARPELKVSFLDRAYQRHYTNNNNLLNYGNYKCMGYLFDFKPYLKKFLYKQYGEWSEVYAPNKTTLRKIIYGKIDKIVEL